MNELAKKYKFIGILILILIVLLAIIEFCYLFFHNKKVADINNDNISKIEKIY